MSIFYRAIFSAILFSCVLTSMAQNPKIDSATSSHISLPIASVKGPTIPISDFPKINWDEIRKMDKSLKLTKIGDDLAQKNNWKEASLNYQQALSFWNDAPSALYGLAKCAEAHGDTTGEINYYRLAVYSKYPSDMTIRENDPSRLMNLVNLLSRSNDDQEAVNIYRHAIERFNIPNHKVWLPTYSTDMEKLSCTPNHLQTMAHVAIAVFSGEFDGQNTLPQLQEAIRLDPDSAIAYYYLGDYYRSHYSKTNRLQARAAYKKAMKLDNVTVGPLAKIQNDQLSYWLGTE